ncbi:hypothetical protein LJK88_38645 [Paenibacillus sp. P26]|nr:hypothetical protein LJK88_38645 [Paenibacillus sp. P26]UUZ93158.1 hypothetical protein LJK87_49645 [Paenibacillus sp. P25]
MLEPGTVLKEDVDFEKARSQACNVEARQGILRIYGPGKISSYGSHQVTIEGKQMLRSVNQFVVV